jgi:hypothetical protein
MAIIKILSRHSPTYASLIGYILRYIVNEGKADKAPIYTNNLRSSNMEGYLKEFIENEAFRRHSRSDQVHLFHEIISFHADEHKDAITPALIDDLTHEYMRLRGSTGVMLGAVHHDKEHFHIHFCVSALHYRTGMSFGLGKQELQDLKVSFQEYHKQRYPELSKSFPKHGSKGRYINHAQWYAQQRQVVIEKVQQCFASAHTQNEFLALLRDNELHHYERNGKPTGIEYEGAKFRFSKLLADKRFESLPIEHNEADIALADIKAVRERQRGRDVKDRDSDVER